MATANDESFVAANQRIGHRVGNKWKTDCLRNQIKRNGTEHAKKPMVNAAQMDPDQWIACPARENGFRNGRRRYTHGRQNAAQKRGGRNAPPLKWKKIPVNVGIRTNTRNGKLIQKAQQASNSPEDLSHL